MFIHNFFDSRAVWLNPLGHKEQASKRHYACAIAVGIISAGIIPALYGITRLVGRCCLANRDANPTIARMDHQRVQIPGNQAQPRQEPIVVSPASTVEEINEQSNEPPTCPITMEPFTQPWILLEDGFTYEKKAIEEWLEAHPNKSPLIREIPSATLLPNCALTHTNPVCPITQRPFQEPYYCVEDGHTYEKDEILKWFEVKITENLTQGVHSPAMVRSPVTGIALNSLTLYPNKILFKDGIPDKQEPVTLDIARILADHSKNTNNPKLKCIFDTRIRDLISLYASTSYLDIRQASKDQIHERRIQLGLKIEKNSFDLPDLSYLDLSKMNLNNLMLKHCIFTGTDFSDSIFTNCDFSRCRFLNCNMQGTHFIDCGFRGEEVSFSGTNMQSAVINGPCHLERGSTWQVVENRDNLRAELRTRGALNVDSIILVNF